MGSLHKLAQNKPAFHFGKKFTIELGCITAALPHKNLSENIAKKYSKLN
jgi:hypothetical protein